MRGLLTDRCCAFADTLNPTSAGVASAAGAPASADTPGSPFCCCLFGPQACVADLYAVVAAIAVVAVAIAVLGEQLNPTRAKAEQMGVKQIEVLPA